MDQELNRLANAGNSFSDLNNASFTKTDWSNTALGNRDRWPISLTCFVGLLATLPHPAAVFWGDGDAGDMTTIHNLSFGKASDARQRQGSLMKDCFPEGLIDHCRSCLKGRTVKVPCQLFLSQTPGNQRDSPFLLSPLQDDHGARHGILAQMPAFPTSEKPLHVQKSSGQDDAPSDSEETRGEVEDEDKEKVKLSKPINLKENKMLQHFAQMLPTGLAVLDNDAAPLFVNDEFFSLTTNRDHELGSFRSWPESIHPDDFDRVMAAYHEAFNTNEPMKVEFRCISGKEAAWRLFMMRSLHAQPDEGGFLCIVVDIGEIKAAELAQRKAAEEAKERKEQQERFIDMISHEIRNPLSAILHSADEIKDAVSLLRKDGQRRQLAEITDAVDTILLCVAHQSALVNDILSFSKIDAMMLTLNPKPVQVKWGFSECLKLFQPELRAKKIQFEYVSDVSYTDMGVDWVFADLKRITQVLVNLMTNAIKFTAKTPSSRERKIMVAMGASRERPTSYPPNVVFFDSDEKAYKMDSTTTNDWGDGETFYLMVAVKDTGLGISSQDQAKLFERFRQATPRTQETYGGSGLGLFISRKLCHLHGGDVGVSSEEGRGSNFGFFFKVRRSEPLESRDANHPEEYRSLSREASDRISQGPSSTKSLDSEGVERQYRLDQPVLSDDEVTKSLNDPPVKVVPEAHPAANTNDSHYKTTSKVASKVKHQSPGKRGKHDSDLQDESQNQQASDDGEKPCDGQLSLLLVEDNQINQRVLQRQLRARGFQVTPANNGQEAVDAVRNGAEIHCVLMDFEMPIMDGISATKAIRDFERADGIQHVPILGVSANVRAEQKESMIEAGMDDCISKPFKVDELVERVRQLLR